MIIGIDASRAFHRRRTGIEEYSYQVIRHLRLILPQDVQVTLYIRPEQKIDFDLPRQWRVKVLRAPRFWTQIRLSFEMFFHPPDILFIPAHTIPIIHPRRTIVTMHGLEYEFFPSGYSLWERFYMRLSIRFSTGVAECIIAVSENTKHDLINLYNIAESKIKVIHEGYDPEIGGSSERPDLQETKTPYFLYVGRLEARKNVIGIIKGYEIFKDDTGLPHQLVLAGKPGYGYEDILKAIKQSKFNKEIKELGFVTSEQKDVLLHRAAGFVFPSFYEGFGLPVLEAQRAGVPIITSNTSSLPEVAGKGALLIDPHDHKGLAQAMKSITSEGKLRADIIEQGRVNTSRFSWDRCAKEIAAVLLKYK